MDPHTTHNLFVLGFLLGVLIGVWFTLTAWAVFQAVKHSTPDLRTFQDSHLRKDKR